MRYYRTFGFRISGGFSLLILAIIIHTFISRRMVARIMVARLEITENLYAQINDSLFTSISRFTGSGNIILTSGIIIMVSILIGIFLFDSNHTPYQEIQEHPIFHGQGHAPGRQI